MEPISHKQTSESFEIALPTIQQCTLITKNITHEAIDSSLAALRKLKKQRFRPEIEQQVLQKIIELHGIAQNTLHHTHLSLFLITALQDVKMHLDKNSFAQVHTKRTLSKTPSQEFDIEETEDDTGSSEEEVEQTRLANKEKKSPAASTTEHIKKARQESPSERTQALVDRFQHIMEHFGEFSYEQVQECKSEIKALMQQANISDTDLQALRELLEQFHSFIQADIVLKAIKNLSIVLKKRSAGQDPLTEAENETIAKFTFFLTEIHGADKAERRLLKSKMWNAAKHVRSLANRHISVLHGATSAAIPVMKRVQAALHQPAPALIPSGYLLRHNFAPLSGELERGIAPKGINQSHLSGVSLSGIELAANYALRRGKIGHGLCAHKIDIPDVTRDLIPKIRALTSQERSSFLVMTKSSSPEMARITGMGYLGLGPLKARVIQFLQLRQEEMPVTEVRDLVIAFRDALSTEIKRSSFSGAQAFLQEVTQELSDILRLFDTVRPFHLTEEENTTLIQPNFPIIWASCSLQGKPISGTTHELAIPTEAAFLGRDIQLAFTDAIHLETLKKEIAHYGVEVIDLNSAMLLNAIPELYRFQ